MSLSFFLRMERNGNMDGLVGVVIVECVCSSSSSSSAVNCGLLYVE